MTKQILSLMACAAFFTTTPAFCMEQEETPEVCLSKLSPELKGEIISRVYEFNDIGSLKGVSKEFNALLANRKKVIFRMRYDTNIAGEDFNKFEFSLFLRDEERTAPVGTFCMIAQPLKNEFYPAYTAEESIPLFLLPGEAVWFPIEFRSPFCCKGICKELPYKYGEPIENSDIPEGSMLVGTVSVYKGSLPNTYARSFSLKTQNEIENVVEDAAKDYLWR